MAKSKSVNHQRGQESGLFDLTVFSTSGYGHAFYCSLSLKAYQKRPFLKNSVYDIFEFGKILFLKNSVFENSIFEKFRF